MAAKKSGKRAVKTRLKRARKDKTMKKTGTKSADGVLFLNPFTCGIYKDGGPRFKRDPKGKPIKTQLDNELGDHVTQLLSGTSPPGAVLVPLATVFSKRILVPRYYDKRWNEEIDSLLSTHGLHGITLGELREQGIISVRGGHGSPSSDVRNGTVPYVKVSDIRSLRVNVNPTNLIPESIARHLWGGTTSGLKAWDVITPNRASSNIGEFAILLPGEEQVVVTKEVFVLRITPEGLLKGWTPFYLFWTLCLRAVRRQWQRIALMQTNREDVADRYKEIVIPSFPNGEWAQSVSKPFKDYFTTLATARTQFVEGLSASGFEYIASAHRVGSALVEPEPVESEEPNTLIDLADANQPDAEGATT